MDSIDAVPLAQLDRLELLRQFRAHSDRWQAVYLQLIKERDAERNMLDFYLDQATNGHVLTYLRGAKEWFWTEPGQTAAKRYKDPRDAIKAAMKGR